VRATLVGLVFAAMIAGIVWFGVVVPRQRAAALAAEVAAIRAEASAAEPTVAPPPRTFPPPSATPSPSPLPTSDEARLVELRKTDAFLEFAEYPRALDAQWLKHGYANFAPHENGEIAFEWVNKAELWNSIAPRIRDEALLLGAEASRPMWNADVLIPAGTDMTWHDQLTAGRGQFVQLSAIFEDPQTKAPVERFWAFLIRTDEDLKGQVVAAMEPFDVREGDSPDYERSRDVADERMWAWVQKQPAAP
jgi:hypothetical protein